MCRLRKMRPTVWDPFQTFSELMIWSAFKLWLFREKAHTKKAIFWPTKSNYFCVTPGDCRRQPLVFKQVKTFLAPPYLTAPQNAWSGSAAGDGHRKRAARGAKTPWILKILAKKVVFLISRAKTQISSLLPPPENILEKSPSAPPWKKSFWRPWWQCCQKESTMLNFFFISRSKTKHIASFLFSVSCFSAA